MSAFVCDNEAINLIVRAGIRWGLVKPKSASLVGQALIEANIVSVTRRYPDVVGQGGDMPGPIGMHPIIIAGEGRAWITPANYRYVPRAEGEARISPAVVRAALARYEYQSCESPSWGESAAKEFCDELTARIGRLLPPPS